MKNVALKKIRLIIDNQFVHIFMLPGFTSYINVIICNFFLPRPLGMPWGGDIRMSQWKLIDLKPNDS